MVPPEYQEQMFAKAYAPFYRFAREQLGESKVRLVFYAAAISKPNATFDDFLRELQGQIGELYDREGQWFQPFPNTEPFYAPPETDYRSHAGWTDPESWKSSPFGVADKTRALYNWMLSQSPDLCISHLKRPFSASSIRNIVPELHVELGGEGCYRGDMFGKPCTIGFSDAINLNGVTENYERGKPIPALLHATDWTRDRFPFEDYSVKRFSIQGLSATLTRHEADEIIRCLDRRGSIHVWGLERSDDFHCCILYLAWKLKALVVYTPGGSTWKESVLSL